MGAPAGRASMPEEPKAERVTTALLAARLDVSEAALYRHFASKAQMFEGLIEFIESSVFTLVNQIVEREPQGSVQARRIVTYNSETNTPMVAVNRALGFEPAGNISTWSRRLAPGDGAA